MTLRCHFFGHRRSASRATYDHKHQQWLSDCKRCHILLVKEPDGQWKPAPPPPDRLEPIRRERAEGKKRKSRGGLSKAVPVEAVNAG